MAAYEVLLLNTTVPQIQAAQAGDTYVVPRDIAFSAALTLSAGTANGVPYLNGSKVLTSGSALTFDGTNLVVGGTIAESLLTVRGTDARILIRDEGTPIRGQFDVDSTNSLVRVGSRSNHPLVFTIQNTEQMRLTSTGLGIGNTNLSALLHVGKVAENADVAIMIGNGATSSYTASTATLQFRQGGNGGATLNAGKIVSGRTGNYSSSADADSYLAFFTAIDNTDTERARIKSEGQFRFVPLAADPSGAEAGDVYYNSGTNKLRLYDGTSWVDLN